jgi:hypothetical protein
MTERATPIKFHDQEAAGFLLLDGRELKGCKGAADLQFGEDEIQPDEGAE